MSRQIDASFNKTNGYYKIKLLSKDLTIQALAWQLALNGKLEGNPDWEADSTEPALQITLKMFNGTSDGHWLRVTGGTTNDVATKMRDEIINYITKDEYHG